MKLSPIQNMWLLRFYLYFFKFHPTFHYGIVVACYFETEIKVDSKFTNHKIDQNQLL